MSDGGVTPLPAATVTLVRDAPGGLEVLLLERSQSLKFMPGAFVFPGGALDPGDSLPEVQSLCAGPADADASRALGIDRGGLAYWIAAIREAFEEAGILLAYDGEGRLIELNGTAGERFQKHRQLLDRGRHGEFGNVLRAEGLRLATDRLRYFGHWITPVAVPRRYDTRFFLAIAPAHQEASPDRTETVSHVWLRPRDALAQRERLGLRFPTIKTLERIGGCATVADAVAEVVASPAVRPLLPRITRDGRTLLPGEPGYDEAGAS
jgi:8-oxo-dGTP pyrophosphatase MutT (NUDIX family)